MKLLVDTNVVLDLAQRRPGFAEAAAGVFAAIEAKRATGFVAGHTLTTAFYVIRRTEGTQSAALAIGDLLRVLEVVPVERADFMEALAFQWRDFEDAVQAVCAQKVGVDVIVTRDLADFRDSRIPAVSPVDALARLAA
ncbi:MAG TPA: PIN domain-containing protein [Longimicrobium sp.]|jgi:predicted nucleic acid-binding protein|uniref:type II toxin-antitoxin system VapC family toxin n=1 Tax=Longimicrobium sp. TaxID=2029185 RepID=UPI002EDA4C9A